MQNFQDAVQNQFYASGGSRGAQQKMKLPQLSEAQLKNLYNQIMPQMQNSMMRKQQERVLWKKKKRYLRKLLRRKTVKVMASVQVSQLLSPLPAVPTSIARRSRRFSTTPGSEYRSTTKEGGSTGTPLTSL